VKTFPSDWDRKSGRFAIARTSPVHGFHDDRGAVGRVEAAHLFGERRLRDELQVRIERQLDAEPILRRLDDVLARNRNRAPEIVSWTSIFPKTRRTSSYDDSTPARPFSSIPTYPITVDASVPTLSTRPSRLLFARRRCRAIEGIDALRFVVGNLARDVDELRLRSRSSASVSESIGPTISLRRNATSCGFSIFVRIRIESTPTAASATSCRRRGRESTDARRS